jgi:hypothetical protein
MGLTEVNPSSLRSCAGQGSDSQSMSVKKEKKRDGSRATGWVILGCVALVLTWQILGGLSRGTNVYYTINAGSFAGFKPEVEGFQIIGLPVSSDPIEPNILAFEVRKTGGQPVLVRLVHGYNMRDCMRIKGYAVDQIVENSAPAARQVMPEFWRLTSGAGDVSVWATGILGAGDFGGTKLSVLDMPFPRVGIPDDPAWVPRGMTWADLRHPVDYVRKLLRSRWNSSRCDWLVFLGLKQPAWASADYLTLVASWQGSVRDPAQEAEARAVVEEAYRVIWDELGRWKQGREKRIDDRG